MVDNNQKVKSRWTRTFFTALNRRNDDERYVCDMCHKDFASPSSLTLHRNTHVIERRYKCEPCQVSFHSQGHLQKHVRSTAHETRVQMTQAFGIPTSDNPRPYGCPECDVAFRKHGHLAKHLRSKSHITKMESNGLVPIGTYAAFEKCSPDIRDRLVTSNCEQSLQSLRSIVMQLSQSSGITLAQPTSASSSSSINNVTGCPLSSASSYISTPGPMIGPESRSSSAHCSPMKAGPSPPAPPPLSNIPMTMSMQPNVGLSPVTCSSGCYTFDHGPHVTASTSLVDPMAPNLPIFHQDQTTPPSQTMGPQLSSWNHFSPQTTVNDCYISGGMDLPAQQAQNLPQLAPQSQSYAHHLPPVTNIISSPLETSTANSLGPICQQPSNQYFQAHNPYETHYYQPEPALEQSDVI